MSAVAIVLAAGAGSRFRGPTHKLDAPIGGQPVVVTAVLHAVDAAIGPVIVVTAEHVRSTFPPTVDVVVHDDWRRGQMSSLRAGLARAAELGADQAVVGLGDQPFIEPASWDAVANAGRTAAIAVATYEGRRGHPVSLAATVWNEMPTTGDEGARALMRVRPELVFEVPCQGSPQDIDTLEDLTRWQNNSSTSSPSTGPSPRPGR